MLDGQASFDSRGLPFFFYNCPENGARGQIASVPGGACAPFPGYSKNVPVFAGSAKRAERTEARRQMENTISFGCLACQLKRREIRGDVASNLLNADAQHPATHFAFFDQLSHHLLRHLRRDSEANADIAAIS